MDPMHLIRSLGARSVLSPAGQADAGNAARWSRYCDVAGGWVQWADVPLADAWFRYARDLTTRDASQPLNALSWPLQRDATIAAWDALSNAFRSLNLPPYSSPDYQVVMQRYYGNPRNRDSVVAAAQHVRELSARGGSGVMPGIIGQNLKEVYQRVRGLTLDPDHPVGEIFVRLSLRDDDAGVQHLCSGWPGAADCDFVPGIARWNGCSSDGVHEGCDPYGWTAWAWHDPPVIGLAAGQHNQIDRALPPMRWSFVVANEIASFAVARGAMDILRVARLYQIAKNIKTAHAAGLNMGQVATTAASIPADLEKFKTDLASRNASQIASTGGTVAAVASQANPAVGAVIGLGVAAAAAVVRILPSAAAFETDEWGRALPVLEASWLQGDALTPPTYSVPAPPGYVAPSQPVRSNCAPPRQPSTNLPATTPAATTPAATTPAATTSPGSSLAIGAGIGGAALLLWWLFL